MGLFKAFFVCSFLALDVTSLNIPVDDLMTDAFSILGKFMPLFLVVGAVSLVYLFGDFFINMFRKLRR